MRKEFFESKAKMLPTVIFDNSDYTYIFTLLRDGKKVVHEFKGSVVIDNKAEDLIKPADRAKIDGPAFDGKFYYICFQQNQDDYDLIWLSKEEFDILDPMLDEIEDDIYERYEYKFYYSQDPNSDSWL